MRTVTKLPRQNCAAESAEYLYFCLYRELFTICQQPHNDLVPLKTKHLLMAVAGTLEHSVNKFLLLFHKSFQVLIFPCSSKALLLIVKVAVQLWPFIVTFSRHTLVSRPMSDCLQSLRAVCSWDGVNFLLHYYY